MDAFRSRAPKHNGFRVQLTHFRWLVMVPPQRSLSPWCYPRSQLFLFLSLSLSRSRSTHHPLAGLSEERCKMQSESSVKKHLFIVIMQFVSWVKFPFCPISPLPKIQRSSCPSCPRCPSMKKRVMMRRQCQWRVLNDRPYPQSLLFFNQTSSISDSQLLK